MTARTALNEMMAEAHSALEARRFLDARDAFLRALAVNDAEVQALCGLAAAYLGLGDGAGALKNAARAFDADPTSLAALHVLAPAAIIMQDRARVAACFAILERSDPARAEELVTFWAQRLADANRFAQAAAVYKSVIDDLPPDVARLTTYADYLVRAMRPHDALAALDRAIALDGRAAGAHALRAHALIQIGELEQAKVAARVSISLDAAMLPAYLALADIEPDAIEDGMIASLASIASDKRNIPLTRGLALLVRGIAFERMSAFDDAFSSFESGNRIVLEATRAVGQGYDRRIVDAKLDLLIDAFPKTPSQQASVGSSAHVFIVGMPRSGTTLMDQILASHSRVVSVGENTGLIPIQAAYERLLSGGGATPSQIAAAHAESWRRAYYASLNGANSRAPVVVDKMVHNFWSVGLINLLFPGARTLIMRRDPMDVCVSIFRLSFANANAFSNDLDDIAHYYRCFDKIAAHWMKVFPETTKTVQYEDILTDFEAVVSDALSFCGLEMEDACRQFHKNKRPVYTLSAAQVRKSLNTSSVGRWRAYEKHLDGLKRALAAP